MGTNNYRMRRKVCSLYALLGAGDIFVPIPEASMVQFVT